MKVSDPKVYLSAKVPSSLRDRVRLESVRRGTSETAVIVAILDSNVPHFDLQVVRRVRNGQPDAVDDAE